MAKTPVKRKILVLGYGDVGKRIVSTLENAGVEFTVVGLNLEDLKEGGFKYVAGDATKESVLKKAGVETASTIVIALNRDTDIIFATMVTRHLNPKSVILARANNVDSISKIYKAGADYVAALPIIAGQILAKIAITPEHKDDTTVTLYHGIEIKKYHIKPGSKLAGKTLAELKKQCTVIGIEENGRVTTDITPSTILREGMTLAVIGGVKS